MTLSQALATRSTRSWSRWRWPRAMGFIWSPDAECAETTCVRKKVNDLLATGASYAMIVRALAADNAELDKRDRVTIDSIRNHARHFPVQNVAKATYREILERRAQENRVDFVEGVATALTPIGVLRNRHGEKL